MWRYRSVVSRLNQLSKLYSTRISYCDMIPIDPDLMFMKKTNADILRLKKQMYALENARVKLHEQIQETIHMIKSLSNVNAQQNKLLTTATTPGKMATQEQDKQSHVEQPNIIYIDEGIVDNKMPVNVSTMPQTLNTVSETTSDEKIGKIHQVQFKKAENQLLQTEGKSEAEVDEESVTNQEANEIILNAEKESADENEAKPVMVSMVANKESEVEGKASIIDKAGEDEELIKVILKDENKTENKESDKGETDSLTEAEDDNAEAEHGINNNELEASTQAVKLNIGQQTKTIKYTDENIVDVFKKASQSSGGTVFIIQKQPNQQIHEITMLERQEQNQSDDDSEPPSTQLQQGGQNTSDSTDDSDLTTQSNQPNALEVQNSQSQLEQQLQQQQEQQQLEQQLQQQEHQHQQQQQHQHEKQAEPAAAKPAVAHFQALNKVSQLLADKKINLNSSTKPIIIILDKNKLEDKHTTLLPEPNAADKNVLLESEIYYKEDTLFYQESITQSNAGTEFNQIYSTIAPTDDKNKKPEETIVMVTKYIPNVEQAQVKDNHEMVTKVPTPKVYNNFVPKCVSQLKGMEDEQWEFEQHSEDVKSNAKTEATDKPGSIIQ